MSRNLSELAFRKGLDGNLFDAYVAAAADSGTVAKPQAAALAEATLVGSATTFGAVSFYDFLKAENAGKRAYVCNGSACLTAGTQAAVHGALRAHLKPDEIGHICCLGRCHENGAFQLGGRNYSGKSPEQIAAIVKAATPANAAAPAAANSSAPDGADRYFVGTNLAEPLLTAPAGDLAAFYAPLEKMLTTPAETLLAELKASGLRGRGGAGFPTHLKWNACRVATGSPKYIVCNADEGDPGAYTDRYLLEERPHAVLFGMLAAGLITGADVGILYVRAEYPEACDRVQAAIDEAARLGWNGAKLRGSGFSFRFKLVKGAGAYICGEETALLASIEGGRPEVRVRPPFPTDAGLFGRPTVVNNVETFACIQPIFARGGAAFAKTGSAASTGTKLTSLDGFFRRPGVYEVAMGTPLKTVIEELGGGLRVPVKAIQIGGPLGGLVPRSHWDRLTVDFESFKSNGFLLGHGCMVCVPESFPLIDYLIHLFDFTAQESCGKCFPCRLGSVRGRELLERAAGRAHSTGGHGGPGAYAAPADRAAPASAATPADRQLFADLLDTLEQGSLCALGGGVPLPIRNALQHFGAELKPYFR
ncbi:MAG: NADH-ubiquinone oxidoreductase-F iron-sulfur binding region domain-containing protein [Planctomycetota bacterium]